jgi:hypothetical protein
MRRALAATAVVLVAAAAPAIAQGPPTRITIVSVFDPITYGDKTFINGQLVGDDQGGQVVTLQAAPFPFMAWTDVAQMSTDYAGYYSFKQLPAATTHYRTVWNGQVMSEREVEVTVAPRMTLKATPAGSKRIRFSGTLAPAHADAHVAIQRQTRSGAWTTVANARLRRGTTFAGRLRARKPIRLRAFFASDGDHLDGFSPAVSVTPRG